MERHALAYIYHWERNTINSLPITERRMWIECIKEQQRAEKEQMDRNTP